MKWYAARLILYTKFKDGIQDTYPVWENVILIKAESVDEAFIKARDKGEFEMSHDHGYTYDGRPAKWIFAGIRRLNECLESFEAVEGIANSPEEVVEITHSEFTIDSEEALAKLVSGETVSIIYENQRKNTFDIIE